MVIILYSLVPMADDQSYSNYYDAKANTIYNAKELESFYKKLDTLLKKKEGKVSIVHIGDSHIQADYFSGELRTRLQYTFGNAGRGFVFPYQIARSNGPIDISVNYNGLWSYNTIMKDQANVNIGASGYTVYANDSAELWLSASQDYLNTNSFNKITVFQSNGNFEPIQLQNDIKFSGIKSSGEFPLTTYILNDLKDSLGLRALSNDEGKVEFHGLVLENTQPGILYHAMGTNGSSTVQYLRSNKFDQQIAALKADLVIISFGTNDCYLPYSRYCSSCTQDRFKKLIEKVKASNPNADILLTSPADHFYRRRYDNRNLYYLNRSFYKLADEEGVAIWDLYTIMGGNRSILTWQRGGLARGDLIHFTKEGYKLQGDLLYNALMEGYESRFN